MAKVPAPTFFRWPELFRLHAAAAMRERLINAGPAGRPTESPILMDYLTICLADELPAIGCGHRHVLVINLTERQATLLEPSSGVVVTMGRESGPKYHGFDELTRGHVRLPYNGQRMIDRIVTNAQANGCWTVEARAACLALGAVAAALPRVPGVADTPAPLPDGVTAPVDGSAAALLGEKIGAFVRRLYLSAAYTPDQIVAHAKAAFPGAKVNRGHVSWYYNDMKKKGVVGLPPWLRTR